MEQTSFDRDKRLLHLKRSRELIERIEALRSRLSRGEYDDADLAELQSILRSLRYDLVGNDVQLSQATGLSGSTIAHTYEGRSRPKFYNFMKMLHGAEQLLQKMQDRPERDQYLSPTEEAPSFGEEVRIRPERSSIFLNELDLVRVQELARASGTSISAIISGALDQYKAKVRRRTKGRDATEQIIVKNRVEIIRYSTAIIAALQEALDYSAERHHNLPPPALRIDDDQYLNGIRNLVSELRRLNDLLEKPSKSNARAARLKAGGFGKHLDKFLTSYSNALGKGAAALTIAAAVGLLAQAGVGQEVIDLIWRHLRRH